MQYTIWVVTFGVIALLMRLPNSAFPAVNAMVTVLFFEV